MDSKNYWKNLVEDMIDSTIDEQLDDDIWTKEEIEIYKKISKDENIYHELVETCISEIMNSDFLWDIINNEICTTIDNYIDKMKEELNNHEN